MSNPIRDEISYAILKIRSRIFFHSMITHCNIVAKKKEEKKLDKPKSCICQNVFLKQNQVHNDTTNANIIVDMSAADFQIALFIFLARCSSQRILTRKFSTFSGFSHSSIF